MSEENFDFTGYYTILLTGSARNHYDTITQILSDCWELYITNVVVLVALKIQHKTAIYTYFPFTQFHCEKVTPVIINYYLAATDSFLFGDNSFFPPKTQNMFQCPILIATCHTNPYMLIRRHANGSIYLDGIEGLAIRHMSQQLNFQPTIVIPPNNERGGRIYKNGTAIGSIGMV